MDHNARFTQQKLEKRLALLCKHRFISSVPIPEFHCILMPEPRVEFPSEDWLKQQPGFTVKVNDYWIGQQTDFLLTAQINPAQADMKTAALYLPLGNMGDIFNHPEALLRIDGRIIGSADRHHHLISIPADIQSDQPFTLSLQGWSGLTGWPFNKNNQARLQMGRCALVQLHDSLECFLTLASCALESTRYLDNTHPARSLMLDALDRAFLELASDQPGSKQWFDSTHAALVSLQSDLHKAGTPLEVNLHAIGHAHIDIAYLWPIAQTRIKSARTCSNQLALMNRFEDYRFSHSQPALYAALAEDYPDVFEQIRQRVAQGRWEALGGMWVEADVNLPGPESLVRQLLLARNWYDAGFDGADTRVLWLPDTFGFPWCLPQLAKQAGIDCIVTNKLSWNQRNPVPSSAHRWRGIDGSEILMHILTTPRQVEHLPFPTNYKSDLSAAEVAGTWTAARSPGPLRDLPICYGFGDGGGGPTEELLRRVQAYQHMPGMPNLQFSTVREFVQQLRKHHDNLSVWDDEHYLEGHRGTYTSQAWLKKANRRMEYRLQLLEAVAVMLNQPLDTTALWQTLCLNQFHDILPGTAVADAMEDARKDFENLDHQIHKLLDQLCIGNNDTNTELALISTLPYPATRIIELDASTLPWDGVHKAAQRLQNNKVCFLADCPAYSIQPLQHLNPADAGRFKALSLTHSDHGIDLSNQWLQLRFNQAGQIVQLIDQQQQRDLLPSGEIANQLQVFEDRPLVWDAWDIDPYFEDRLTCLDNACELRVTEQGPLLVEIEASRKFRDSTLTQCIRLYRHSRRIDFHTVIDWQEPQSLLKVSFPVAIRCRYALYDIQWGQIERPTHRNTSWEQARFEVPAQKWACLREPGYAIALLNDCKYGYDIVDNRIRLTLIKSSSFPDPKADIGKHEFTYSLLADSDGSLHSVNVESWEINAPAVTAEVSKSLSDRAISGFILCDNPRIEVQTIKPAENGDGFIVRFYECAGSHTVASLQFNQPLGRATRCDILEQDQHQLTICDRQISIPVSPFEIVTLRCRHLS